MEMYVGYDEQVTDLHDCSNDLSDKGSKKEEYEHLIKKEDEIKAIIKNILFDNISLGSEEKNGEISIS